MSLGYIAERVGLPKRDLIRKAHSRGIEPPFDEQMVNEELDRSAMAKWSAMPDL